MEKTDEPSATDVLDAITYDAKDGETYEQFQSQLMHDAPDRLKRYLAMNESSIQANDYKMLYHQYESLLNSIKIDDVHGAMSDAKILSGVIRRIENAKTRFRQNAPLHSSAKHLQKSRAKDRAIAAAKASIMQDSRMVAKYMDVDIDVPGTTPAMVLNQIVYNIGQTNKQLKLLQKYIMSPDKSTKAAAGQIVKEVMKKRREFEEIQNTVQRAAAVSEQKVVRNETTIINILESIQPHVKAHIRQNVSEDELAAGDRAHKRGIEAMARVDPSIVKFLQKLWTKEFKPEDADAVYGAVTNLIQGQKRKRASRAPTPAPFAAPKPTKADTPPSPPPSPTPTVTEVDLTGDDVSEKEVEKRPSRPRDRFGYAVRPAKPKPKPQATGSESDLDSEAYMGESPSRRSRTRSPEVVPDETETDAEGFVRPRRKKKTRRYESESSYNPEDDAPTKKKKKKSKEKKRKKKSPARSRSPVPKQYSNLGIWSVGHPHHKTITKKVNESRDKLMSEWVKHYTKENGYGPSQKEVADQTLDVDRWATHDVMTRQSHVPNEGAYYAPGDEPGWRLNIKKHPRTVGESRVAGYRWFNSITGVMGEEYPVPADPKGKRVSAPVGSRRGAQEFGMAHAMYKAKLPDRVSTRSGAPTKQQTIDKKFESRGVAVGKNGAEAVPIHYALEEAQSRTNKSSAHHEEPLFTKTEVPFVEAPIWGDLKSEMGATSKGFYKKKYTQYLRNPDKSRAGYELDHELSHRLVLRSLHDWGFEPDEPIHKLWDKHKTQRERNNGIKRAPPFIASYRGSKGARNSKHNDNLDEHYGGDDNALPSLDEAYLDLPQRVFNPFTPLGVKKWVDGSIVKQKDQPDPIVWHGSSTTTRHVGQYLASYAHKTGKKVEETWYRSTTTS